METHSAEIKQLIGDTREVRCDSDESSFCWSYKVLTDIRHAYRAALHAGTCYALFAMMQ